MGPTSPLSLNPSPTRAPAAKVATPNAPNRQIPPNRKAQTNSRGAGKTTREKPRPRPDPICLRLEQVIPLLARIGIFRGCPRGVCCPQLRGRAPSSRGAPRPPHIPCRQLRTRWAPQVGSAARLWSWKACPRCGKIATGRVAAAKETDGFPGGLRRPSSACARAIAEGGPVGCRLARAASASSRRRHGRHRRHARRRSKTLTAPWGAPTGGSLPRRAQLRPQTVRPVDAPCGAPHPTW